MQNPLIDVFTEASVVNWKLMQHLALTKHFYVIFNIPRSGSTWLTERAKTSGMLGEPTEWFNEDFIARETVALGAAPPKVLGTADINKYIIYLIERNSSRGGVFGVELSRFHTEWICELLENKEGIMKLFKPFYLRRENMVRQAISLYKSAETGYFHSYQMYEEFAHRLDALSYDSERICFWYNHLIECEIWFERMFHEVGLEPDRFFYEDLTADIEAVLNWMYARIVPRPDTRISVRAPNLINSISDNTNIEWETRFRLECAAFIEDMSLRRPKFTKSYKLLESNNG